MTKEKQNVLWNEIYNELKKPIPIGAVQTKDVGDKAQGYNIAFLIDRLNSVLVPRGCSWEQFLLPLHIDENGNEILYLRDTIDTMYKGNSSQKTSVCVRLRIKIKDPLGNVIAEKESFGGCQIINNQLGDTLKGAMTDAMKKIFSYLGLGDEAYKGGIQYQLLGFRYKVEKLYDRIKDVLKKVHGIETVNDKIIMRYICSVVEKKYTVQNNLTEKDIELLEKDLDRLEKTKPAKKVKNEQQSEVGTDQVPSTEEPVDNPF